MSERPSISLAAPAAGLPRDREGRVLVMALDREALIAWVAAVLADGRRAGDLRVPERDPEALAPRIEAALYRGLAPTLGALPGASPALRRRLAAAARVDALTLHDRRAAGDGTHKLVFRTDDGGLVEAVVIPGRRRTTLCISSQIGCAMRCHFCLTGKMGLAGDLTAAEIIDQVVQARRLIAREPALTGGKPLANVVFMGMGEPLHNPEAVLPAIRRLVDPAGLDLSSRRVTVSTSGIVPGIDRLGGLALGPSAAPVQLAVSLNATTDAVRDWLMPINRRYPIASLLAAIRRYPLRPRARVMVEYVLLAGVNDTAGDVERLATLLHGLPIKVNLIAFNPHPGSELRRPEPAAIARFCDELRGRGITAVIRATRGDATMAACGQLGQLPNQATSQTPSQTPNDGARMTRLRLRSPRPQA